jgi:hypothetical protein
MAAAQHKRGRQLRGLAALRFAADLDDDALALVEPPTAREGLALRQKGRAVAADLDECRAQRGQQTGDPPEMDAAGLGAVAAFDAQLDRRPVLQQRCAPFAGAGGNHELAAHRGR